MARQALKPNPENCSLAELETAIKAAPTQRSAFRLQAIKALFLGAEHDLVAQLYSVSRQTLLIWIKAFYAQGLDGLSEKPHPGRPPLIPADQSERLCDLLVHPDQAQIEHWTAKKFHGFLRQDLDCELSYRTVVRWLHEHDFRLKVPQPWPDRQEEEERRAWLTDKLAPLLADPEAELWYMDEMGVEGDPRPRRRWAKIGEKTRVTHNGDHLRLSVSGMVCPRTGAAFLLEFSHADREIFQAFLDQANQHVATGRRRNVIILDNASWHKCKSLRWGKFEPLPLPPYSPDFNPIERLWLLIKAEWFSDFVAKGRAALEARLDRALLWAMGRAEGNRQTCAIH
jgi:transposase